MALVMLAASSEAQTRQAFPIGYVSLQRVFTEAADAKSATQQIEAARQAKAQELNGMKQALDATKLELANSGGFFRAARRTELQREVQQREDELKKASEAAAADLKKLQDQLQADLQKELDGVLKSIAERRGLLYVLNQDAAIVMAPSGADLTAEVLEQLQATAAGRETPAK
jgi:Skp family chaperone for outer membrane proteins